MNSWKTRLLFGTGTRASSGPRDIGPEVGALGPGARSMTGRLMASFLQRAEVIVMETKWRAMTKREKIFCFPNGLAKLLGESF